MQNLRRQKENSSRLVSSEHQDITLLDRANSTEREHKRLIKEILQPVLGKEDYEGRWKGQLRTYEKMKNQVKKKKSKEEPKTSSTEAAAA